MNAALITALMADGCQLCGGGSGWWMGGMVVWMVVFWAALILGTVWLVRVSLERRLQREQEPGEILDHRFAEGAITFDEYHEQKAALFGEQKDPRDGTSTHGIAGG